MESFGVGPFGSGYGILAGSYNYGNKLIGKQFILVFCDFYFKLDGLIEVRFTDAYLAL